MNITQDIHSASTEDLLLAQNETWWAIFHETNGDERRVTLKIYLRAIEKELNKRIGEGSRPSLSNAIKQWNDVSTDDDKRIVAEIAKESKTCLSKNDTPLDVRAIATRVSKNLGCAVFEADVEVALGMLVADGVVKPIGNMYQIA